MTTASMCEPARAAAMYTQQAIDTTAVRERHFATVNHCGHGFELSEECELCEYENMLADSSRYTF
jgi:hypothetical protein